MRPEIYRLLQESESESPFWSPAFLMQLVNEARDEVDAIIMGEAFEGYREKSVTTNIVAGQAHYQVPEDCNRILRIERRYTDGRVFPLQRLDRYAEPTIAPGGSSSGVMDSFTYRMEDEHILLEPVPSDNYTDGLQISYEWAMTKIDDDGDDVTPASWPYITETLVKYMVVCMAFEMEGAQGQTNTPYYTSYIKKRDLLTFQLREYVETRSHGRQYRTQHWLGD